MSPAMNFEVYIFPDRFSTIHILPPHIWQHFPSNTPHYIQRPDASIHPRAKLRYSGTGLVLENTLNAADSSVAAIAPLSFQLLSPSEKNSVNIENIVIFKGNAIYIFFCLT